MNSKKDRHLTKECYLSYRRISMMDEMDLGSPDWLDIDSICEQVWAEIHIMRTLKVRDIR